MATSSPNANTPLTDRKAVESALRSETGLAYNTLLFDWLFLEKAMKARQERFNAEYEAYMASLESQYANLTDVQRQGLSSSFVQEYFDVEHDALAKYNCLAKEHADLSAIPDKERTPEQQRRIKQVASSVALGAEGYITKTFFEPANMRALKLDYSDELKALKAERQTVKDADFADVDSRVAYRPATVKMFNDAHPGLLKEMQSLAGHHMPSKRDIGRSAMMALTVTSAVASMGTSLLVKAAIGFAGSKAMAPVRGNIAKNLNVLAEKSGIKPYAKEKLSKVPAVKMKNIAAGVGVGAVGILTFMSVDPENALEVAGWLQDKMLNWADAGPQQALADTPTTMDAALAASPPETEDPLAGISSPADPEAGSALTGADPGPVTDSKPVFAIEKNGADGGWGYVDPVDTANAEPNPVPQVGDEVDYVVQPEDTLSEIVEAHLQAQGIPYTYQTIEDMYLMVQQINAIPDPDRINPEQLLKLPVLGNIPPDVDMATLLQEKYQMGMGGGSSVPSPSPSLEDPRGQHTNTLKRA